MNGSNLGGTRWGGLRLSARYARMAAWAIGFVAVVAVFGAGHAAGGTPLLWSGPTAMAAGDSFLIVGYDRGVVLWQWHTGAVPIRIGQRPGPAVTTMWAGDSTVIWCEADSTLCLARIQGDAIDVRWQMPLPGPGIDATSSADWIAVNVNGDSVLIVPMTGPGAGANWWLSGRSAGLAAIALRDSTLAVGGGEHVDLIRVRDGAAVTLDSIALGSFVLDAVWAGDTLAMAVGFSGVKLIRTKNDRFDGPPSSRLTGGTCTVVATTDRTWAAFDWFGAVEIFARGTSLTPAASLSSSGILSAAAGRGNEYCILSLENGMSVLNVFTPQAPFWSGQQRLPGFVRSLAPSALGMLAQADFAGVYRLGDTLSWWLMEHPFNAADLHADSHLVAATTLLGGVGIFALDSQLQQLPLANVRPPGFVRHGRLDGDRMYVLNTPSCDSGLSEYDVSTSQFPVLTSRLSVCATVRDMELVPDGVALALADSGIWVYPRPFSSISEPVARTAVPATWRQLSWHDSDLWSLGSAGDIVRWQWNDPLLVELDRFGTTATMQAFAVWADRLATVDTTGDVSIWTWQTGGGLSLRESFQVQPGSREVAMIHDTVWVVERDAVMRVELSPTAGIGDHDPEVVLPRRLLLEPPWPNPFNGNVRVAVQLEPGDWRVDIINVLGQRVTGWSGRARSPQRLLVDWSPAPGQASGVYFVRAHNAGYAESRSAVFMK